MASSFLLEIRGLCVSFFNKRAIILNSDFLVSPGEIVGLFGDSGSGKSVFSFFVLGFLNSRVFSFSAKKAFFKTPGYSFSLLNRDSSCWDVFRGQYVSMVFQDPSVSLNPTMSCGKQVEEVFFGLDSVSSKKRCLSLFKEVEINNPEKIYRSYPHEISGGQKQRVIVAIALASKPKLLIADEPTTSLDPTIQRSVLDLILKLSKKRKMGVVLISHNFKLIKHYCNSVYFFKNMRFTKTSNSSVLENLVNNFSSLVLSSKKNLFLKNLFLKKPVSSSGFVFNLSNVSVVFKKNKNSFFALKKVSFCVKAGECLGVLGGSGSGKTTLGRVLCGLENNFSGLFIKKRGVSVQMVYQDPFSSFNPKKTIGNSVLEILDLYKSNHSVSDLFKIVSLKDDYINSYPHEISGGQKQRASIARVLASNPDVIIFDESLSALDLKTSFSILELIYFINFYLKITIVFISHDINIVSSLCKKIIVLKNGVLEDSFYSDKTFSKKRKIYTKNLISDFNFS